jgi:hypothetical protein
MKAIRMRESVPQGCGGIGPAVSKRHVGATASPLDALSFAAK